MTDLVGKQLGNYRLLRLLGRGGFAEVYLGEHVLLGTTSALKVLQTQLADEEHERFLQEARVIARLSHPHIVRVLDFGIEDTIPFLVMEYAPHGSLRQRWPKGTRLSPQEIAPFVRQAAAALHYAHEQQVIHRDVKPENMLLGQHDELLLTDFGIAVIAQTTRSRSTQDVVGTVAYMAPEQIQSNPQPASDQYALGIVVYEWLCGAWPFHGSFTEVCSQHLFTPPPPLHEKVPTLAPPVEVVVEKALAKEPHERFPTIEAMAEAFEDASRAEAPTVFTVPPTVRRSDALAATKYPDSASTPATRSAEAGRIPPTQQAAPQELPSLPSAPAPKKRGISRRAIIAGAAGAGLVVAAGGLAWLALSQSRHPSSTERFTAPPSPVPSRSPRGVGSTLLVYQGHTGAVYSIAWSPNGQYIASASADTTVHVWNITTGETLYVYRGHAGLLNDVFSVGWAPHGRLIASGSADKTVQVWDAATGNQSLLYSGHTARVLAVSWSPDGTYIASGSADDTVQVWDAGSGKLAQLYPGHSGTVYTVAWSPDGTLIASGGVDKTVQVWDAATGKSVQTYTGHNATVYSIAWSPDGTYLASGSGDRTVQVWNARTGEKIYTYNGYAGLSTAVSAVSWSPDEKRIASGSTDKTVQLWGALKGEDVYTYHGHTGTVYAVEWAPPGGQYIASGSDDTTVRIWQTT